MLSYFWSQENIEETPVVTEKEKTVMDELLEKIKSRGRLPTDDDEWEIQEKVDTSNFLTTVSNGSVVFKSVGIVDELNSFKRSEMRKPTPVIKVVKSNPVSEELKLIRSEILKSSYLKMCKFSPHSLNNNDFSDWIKKQIELLNELDAEDKLFFLMILVDRVVSYIELTKNPEHYKKIKDLVDRFLPELKTTNSSSFAEGFIKARLN